MKLFNAELGYIYHFDGTADENWSKTEADKNIRKVILDELGVSYNEAALSGSTPFLIDANQFAEIQVRGIRIELKGIAYESKVLAVPETSKPVAQAEYFNNRVQVHISGPVLTHYNELMLCENACSDALQKHLDMGWRIVSVCVQPNNRRPDYILGRFNINRDTNSDHNNTIRG